jgi:hypothetical protein
MTHGLLAFSVCIPHYSNRYAKSWSPNFSRTIHRRTCCIVFDESAETGGPLHFRQKACVVHRLHFMNLPPTNGLLGRFRNVDGADLKDGNVLIIKHPLRDVHHIENMTHANLACAGKLLEWCVKRGDL